MNKPIVFSLLTLLLMATGCSMMPKYERPASPVPEHWPDSCGSAPCGTNTVAAPMAADIQWTSFFGDPRLKELIGLALTNNRDLRIAVLNVESARAQYRIQRSALLPTVNAEAGMTRSRNPGDLSGTGQATTSSDYSVKGAVASYEVDLFGRVRSLKAQALETFLSKKENQKNVQISLVAEVADQYLVEREMDELLILAGQTYTSVQSNHDLILAAFKLGNTTEQDLRSAEIQVQNARSSVASYQRQKAQAQNALELLLGCSLPTNLPPAQPLNSQKILTDLSPELPSDLLQRRPDILEAEHTLKAANANIGAARAAFFPKILLTGSAGTASADLSGLFAPGSSAWSFSPQITMPIFDMGNTKASYDIAKLNKRIEIAQYETVIQRAFREVSDALVAKSAWDTQLDANHQLVMAEQQRYDLATARFHEGIDSYLDVLTAQQDLYSSQQTLLQTRYMQLANRIELYRALGGGWNDH